MMTELQIHKDLYDILQKTTQFIITSGYIELSSYDSNVEEKLIEIGLSSEKIGSENLRILINNTNIKIFKNIDEFNSINSIDNNSNILILEKEPVSFLKGETYNNFDLTKDDFLIENAKAYLEFQAFLKEQESETDESFHFVDSYNLDFRKLIFVSLAENGRLSITYNADIPNFDRTYDFGNDLLIFQKLLYRKFKNFTKVLEISSY